MTTDSGRSQINERIVDLAQQMLSGKLEVIAGSRMIAHLAGYSEYSDDERFHAFVAVASETDDFPTEDDPQNWEPTAWARKELERREYASRVKEIVLAECRALVEKLRPAC